MKKIVVFLLSAIAFCSCEKNEYLDASIDKTTVEFASTNLNETISFIAAEEYKIPVPIQIFGGKSTSIINVKVDTKMAQEAYSISASQALKGSSLDTIFVTVKTSKLKKGITYSLNLTLESSDVKVSSNYKSCAVTFVQQAFMDFFTGIYSCKESSTGSTYDVEFTKMNDSTIKNNNFYDFPLAGQYVPYVFVQDESLAISIPEDYEWTDNLGHKYLISGIGSYELNGNFKVDFTMKDAVSEQVYQIGTHSFRKK